MYTLAIFAALGIIIGFILGKRDDTPFLGGFGGLVVGILVGLLMTLIFSIFFPHYEVSNKHNIIAMKDGSSIYGSMFLGSGTINEKQYYFYYEKEADGAITQHKLLVNCSKIFEDSPDSTGWVELHYFKTKEPYNNWAGCGGEREFDHAEIHVPKGSVVREYKMDLE